jgi:hypothetical protein
MEAWIVKPVKLTAYDSRDRVTTEYSKAVGWGHSDKTLPRHGGGCSATWQKPLASVMGENAPQWLYAAERMRRAALRGEHDDS